MFLVFATILAGLLGLAFGSFLNVCATRWPEGESVVTPRSHCRSCSRTLTWYENIPLGSWIALRGRCAGCGARIGWRYPLVELAVGSAWAYAAWRNIPALWASGSTAVGRFDSFFFSIEEMTLCWLLIGLAVLDVENLWLPDRLTLGGAVAGLPFTAVRFTLHSIWNSTPLHWTSGLETPGGGIAQPIVLWALGVLIAPALILLIRWAYQLVRRRQGVGLGDAKLMLLLAAWLGLSHTALAFFVGVVLGALFALFLLLFPARLRQGEPWPVTRLPLGTFLCIGGIVSAFWGTPIINWYLRAAGVL